MTPQEFSDGVWAIRRVYRTSLKALIREYYKTCPIKIGDYLTDKRGRIIRVEQIKMTNNNKTETVAPILYFWGLIYNSNYGICRPHTRFTMSIVSITKHEKPDEINRIKRIWKEKKLPEASRDIPKDFFDED
jgi:hypothetical protein